MGGFEKEKDVCMHLCKHVSLHEDYFPKLSVMETVTNGSYFTTMADVQTYRQCRWVDKKVSCCTSGELIKVHGG